MRLHSASHAALFPLDTANPLRGVGKRKAARPFFLKLNNDGNVQHGWQFYKSCPARLKVGPQRDGDNKVLLLFF